MNTQHVLIETLTPLHIGSGRFLQGNTEYLYFSDTATVALVDERKVLTIIGEENLDQWVQIIDSEGDLLDYVSKRKAKLRPDDVAKRTMRAVGSKKPAKWQKEGKTKFPTIREQLFSGNGQPILPGSSLKGAIRTAFFNALVQANPSATRRIEVFKQVDEKQDSRTGQARRIVKYNGVKLEKQYLGQDPNHDVFRLLRIGDAHFDETVCLLSETLNEKGGRTFEMKDDVKQLIECIPAGAEALCRMQIPSELLTRLRDPRYRETADKIPHRDRIDWVKLIADINANTHRLINKELNRYQSQTLPDEANEYLDTLRMLMSNLKDNQCVIRVGFGTGYLNMTGGWAEEYWRNVPDIDFHKEMDDLAEGVRRNARYNAFDLPKSRKMALGGVPLGFLKLTFFSEIEFADWQSKAAEREAEKAQLAEAALVRVAQEAAEAETKRLADEAEAKRLAEEARKPKWFAGLLKQGQELDAEVTVSARTNKVKVYAAGYESKTFDLIGYIGAEPVGKVLIVKADQLDKKKNLVQVRYLRFK